MCALLGKCIRLKASLFYYLGENLTIPFKNPLFFLFQLEP